MRALAAGLDAIGSARIIGQQVAADAPMQQLSAQDASFLYFEGPRTPMHIGGVMVYDPSTVRGGRQRFTDILAFIEERLHLARTFRQKLVRVPLDLDHPWWIEDRDFDLEYHVRHIRLPEPGDWRQLCIQVARLHARPLDVSKPLWEFTVIEGLDAVPGLPTGSYAVVSKVHHAAVDGVSGVDLVQALHGLEPYPDSIPPPARTWYGETPPSPGELLFRAQMKGFSEPLRFAEALLRAGARPSPRRSDGETRGAPTPQPVPHTRFGRAVSPHRVMEARQFPVSAIRTVRRQVPGATLNDVILAICGGALRRYLAAKNELPDSSLVAMVPISVRGGAQDLGNRVAAMNVAIGSDCESPLERLAGVHASSRHSKAIADAVGARQLTDFARFVPAAMSAAGARLFTEFARDNPARLPFNCVVTNVPGPQVPLYSAGARLVSHYGLGPIYDGMGLMLPVFSYCGAVNIAVNACRDIMPDPDFFADCLDASWFDLSQAAGVELSTPA
ncbi:MAG: WS/DGAT/MGAT family O-acyltransferase [Pseudomonadales bacterium]